MTTPPVPAAGYGACPWPVDPACLTDDWDAYAPEVQDRAVALASATLHRLTGYQVGGCPITVRPCKKSCTDVRYALPYTARGWMNPSINTQGMWINSCGCTTDCSCTEVCEIALPGPVGEVYLVDVGGLDVDPLDYRIDNGNLLVWRGPTECPWPACQDMTADVNEPGSFSITYLNSFKPDQLAAYAAGILAAEYAKACTGNKCRLPITVTSVSRQGLNFEVPTGAFPDGFTGIREVDAYIALWNPQGRRQQTSVWSPDLPRNRVAW